MVDGKSSHLEWESGLRGEHRCSDRDRCLKQGAGDPFFQGVLMEVLMEGCWNAQEAKFFLEMRAAFYVIKTFKEYQGISVLLRTDMSVVTYVH